MLHDNSRMLQALETLLEVFNNVVLFLPSFIPPTAETLFILTSCCSSNFDELSYFKFFDISGALLCREVEVGLEKVSSCLGRTETAMRRSEQAVFPDFQSKQ